MAPLLPILLLLLLSSALSQPLLNISESYTFTLRHNSSLTFTYQLDQPADPRAKRAIRLSVSSEDASSPHPILVVVRQTKGVTSWAIPYVESGYSYPSLERTLCPLLDEGNETSLVLVDFSTSSPSPLNFTLFASVVHSFSLSLNQPVDLTASPSGPAYYLFEFPPNKHRVRVKFRSTGGSSSICAIASIQHSFCPVVELLDNPHHRGTFQTLQGIAAINTELMSNSSSQRTVFDFFYVVVTVFPNNDDCQTTLRGVAENLVTLDVTDNYNPTPFERNPRDKNVTITVESALSDSAYAVAVVVATLLYLSFYVIAIAGIFLFEWWWYNHHPVKKYLEKALSMDIEEAVVGGRSEGEEACPSPHGLTQGSPTRDDEPDMGIRKLMKKQPSMQRSSRGRGSVKRPSLLDVFRGSHWDRALGQTSPPPTSSHHHASLLHRQHSEGDSLNVAHLRRSAHHRHPHPAGVRPRLSRSQSAEGRVGVRVTRSPVEYTDKGLDTTPTGVDQPDSSATPLDADLGMGAEGVEDPWEATPHPLEKQSSYDEAISSGVRADMEREEEEEEGEEEYSFEYTYDKGPFPVNLLLCELDFEDHPVVQKEYNRYSWYLLAVIIFYGIPAFQLVVTYQQLLNISGNEDICYYNSLCSHPWKISDTFTLSAFNNVFSNIGYVVLGLLYILLAYRRRTSYRTFERINCDEEDPRKRVGVPQRFGIYYAIGLALIAEAFMSAAYHICPSNANYQFDTTYMFVLAGLGLYKLVQNRCPDLVPGVHRLLLVLAFIIALVVLGVLYSGTAFYVVFFFVFNVLVFGVTVEVYYRWQIKSRADIKAWLKMLRTSPWQPKQRPKFVMVIISNLVNFIFSLYGVIVQPEDFSTLFLTIMVANFLLALLYYSITKFVYREWPTLDLRWIAYFLLALILWITAAVYYSQSVTNWLKSPAASRDGNEECIILDFYDSHDLWHFLSAFALFFSFVMLMNLDDNQQVVCRSKLRVF